MYQVMFLLLMKGNRVSWADKGEGLAESLSMVPRLESEI